MRFEWDEQKRLANIEKHGIDFLEAKEIWQDDVLQAPSPQAGHRERRFIAYGLLSGRVIAVVFTWRGNTRRLISARRARDYERKAYQKAFGRGS
jgi:uncharacterized DUF497 family protein